MEKGIIWNFGLSVHGPVKIPYFRYEHKQNIKMTENIHSKKALIVSWDDAIIESCYNVALERHHHSVA